MPNPLLNAWINLEDPPDEVIDRVVGFNPTYVWWFDATEVEKKDAWKVALEPFLHLPRHPLRAHHTKNFWIWYATTETMRIVGCVPAETP